MYQGSNVSYNLKKLVAMGYVHHERCDMDRRSVRVRLTAEGQAVRDLVQRLFIRHAEGLAMGPEAVAMGFAQAEADLQAALA